MLVDNLTVINVSLAPPKADSPLVVNANATLAFAISRKLLQVVARRNSKIVERFRSV